MFWDVDIIWIFLPFTRESIEFSTLSETEVLKVSEVQVSRGLYYNETRKPYAGGLLDPHMVMSCTLSFDVGFL